MTTKVPFALLSSIATPSDIAEGTATNKLITVAQGVQIAQAFGGFPMEFYTTGRTNAEIISSLPLDNVGRVVMTVGPIPDLTTDDMILCVSGAEFSNEDAAYNIRVESALFLASSAGGITGGKVAEFNGRNISLNMHHDTHEKIGMLRSTINGTGYVNFVSRAASSSATEPIVVEPDYGHLDVLVFKGFFG
ncbi:hypothetical protein [Nitratireductor rhodophyticola]|uniref:hypothetical protein n=1 Tax=Nitratireductor rhodophyticola TaxID=2854036 RepID=UPI003009551B